MDLVWLKNLNSLNYVEYCYLHYVEYCSLKKDGNVGKLCV